VANATTNRKFDADHYRPKISGGKGRRAAPTYRHVTPSQSPRSAITNAYNSLRQAPFNMGLKDYFDNSRLPCIFPY